MATSDNPKAILRQRITARERGLERARRRFAEEMREKEYTLQVLKAEFEIRFGENNEGDAK